MSISILEIAQIAHEANRSYCQSIGDDSQPTWNEAPKWQRDSAINGVRYHLENPAANAEQSHENWLAEKLADGWSYGPTKDVPNKRHPCIMPYRELPEDQRIKDHIFRNVIHGVNAVFGK